MVTVRKATLEDYDALSEMLEEVDALHRQALPHLFRAPPVWPARSREEVSALLADEQALVLVAEEGGRIVGVNIAKMVSAPDTPLHVPRRLAHVGPLVVSWANHHRGIGRMLMEGALDWARQQGVGQIELNVFEFNQGAIKFYEKLGFKTLSRKMEISLDIIE